ncbi:MAG TPA: TOBE domain-containing protein, partial [Reyranella sp.]|nr:TOBE domain-containing protein [Reyranella sp.]
GPTAQVYHRPADLATAGVFSDPPLNTLRVTKSGGSVRLATGVTAPATGVFATVPDGDYTMGVRAHHLAVVEAACEAEAATGDVIRLDATVSVAEITGSESYLHMDVGSDRLIALVPGVRRLEPGAYVSVVIDPRHVLLFDTAGGSAGAVLDAAA